MEGVGARVGRSSRYGGGAGGPAAAVFNGPVRKWKKSWVETTSPPSALSSSSSTNKPRNSSSSHTQLLLYKWTPVSSTATPSAILAAPSEPPLHPPHRKFRFVPVSLIEEKLEAASKADKEIESDCPDQSLAANLPDDKVDEKLDVYDLPMEGTQAWNGNQQVVQELIGNNLDLNLGWKAHSRDSDQMMYDGSMGWMG